jgi:glycine dehydrogenase subunit 1
MPYFLNTPEEQRAMLEAIGAGSLEELFAMVPAGLRLGRPLNVPPAMCELELTDHMTALAGRNTSAEAAACFLGGGSYDHFIPAVVDFIASRSEFTTSYTPYQAEVSQGNLQALFEYQTLVTQLTGMDVSNSSLYDGGSAAVEAVLMAMHATGRPARVVTARSVHPEYRQILATYLANAGVELVTVGVPDGGVSPAALEAAVDERTACVLLQHPNFFGCLEDMPTLAEIAHRRGALLAVVFDPISLGLLKRPGDYGADIAVAEGQSLGNPMSFGGPYLGIMACREQFVRRMPGRLVGQTVDRRGKRCWVLTLQTREQHIRRDKATSNICTNQGLLALRAAVYLAAVGPDGLRTVADLCLQKARYAAARLTSGASFTQAFARPTFKEFVVRVPGGRVDEFLESALRHEIFAGVPLARWYPDLADGLLIAVTEKRTRAQIDRLAALCM